MAHGNATLTEAGRLRLARFHVEQRATLAQTAERFQVSTTTVRRWVGRYRQVLAAGRRPVAADMTDRSSRPRRSPNRTHRRLERRIRHQRVTKRLGPQQLGSRLGVPTSTVHAVLVRMGLNRLRDLDRATGVRIRRQAQDSRYERAEPGSLLHVDIKKLAKFREVGHRITGDRRQGRNRRVGWEFVYVCVDDASRLAYVETLEDEQATTAVAFLERALSWYRRRGIRARRIMTDNGSPFVSKRWAGLCRDRRVRHLRTRPYTPRTNGKAERFIQTLQREWAYGKAYKTSWGRRRALPSWLRYYNDHRPHRALGMRSPRERLRRA